MRKVYIFEKNCCGPSPSEQLINFLQSKFNDNFEIKSFDLGSVTGTVPIPTDLLLRIQTEGTSCLPSFVVDGEVMTEGGLPNFFDAVELIKNGRQASADIRLDKGSSCC